MEKQMERTKVLWNYVSLWSFLDVKWMGTFCKGKQVNIYSIWYFCTLYINTISLFWHDVTFDRSHGVLGSDGVKASCFGEHTFERPCIRGKLAVLISSNAMYDWGVMSCEDLLSLLHIERSLFITSFSLRVGPATISLFKISYALLALVI